ncbi:hypothetical protein SprV_0902722000 [Sparganum proliferum]
MTDADLQERQRKKGLLCFIPAAMFAFGGFVMMVAGIAIILLVNPNHPDWRTDAYNGGMLTAAGSIVLFLSLPLAVYVGCFIFRPPDRPVDRRPLLQGIPVSYSQETVPVQPTCDAAGTQTNYVTNLQKPPPYPKNRRSSLDMEKEAMNLDLSE